MKSFLPILLLLCTLMAFADSRVSLFINSYASGKSSTDTMLWKKTTPTCTDIEFDLTKDSSLLLFSGDINQSFTILRRTSVSYEAESSAFTYTYDALDCKRKPCTLRFVTSSDVAARAFYVERPKEVLCYMGYQREHNRPEEAFKTPDKGKANKECDDCAQEIIVAEQPAEFIGGMTMLYRWLGSNVKYPESLSEASFQGRAIVQFVIAKDGSVTQAKVVRSAGDADVENEALRAISSMPRWIPARHHGHYIAMPYTLPILFRQQ